jgi:hypothetical protein
MTADVPAYVSIVFILTALLTVGIFIFAIIRAGLNSLPARLLLAFLLLWMVVTAVLASNGFYQDFDVVPPRTFALGALPFLLIPIVYLLFFRDSFLTKLPLTVLTLIHVIRIPIEIVLLWLYQSGQVPVEMTFEGRNFDILSGITAPIVYFIAFRGDRVNRPVLVVWNLAALALLANIVTIAVLAFPSPFQMVGLDQPNIGVTYFPFIWLPAVIVPMVFFCHVASLYKLISGASDAADRR